MDDNLIPAQLRLIAPTPEPDPPTVGIWHRGRLLLQRPEMTDEEIRVADIRSVVDMRSWSLVATLPGNGKDMDLGSEEDGEGDGKE